MEPKKKVRLARRRESRVYQEDWGQVARIYDLEQPACRGDELGFWRTEASAARANAGAGGDSAENADGEVLELAAGSGRVAIALARAGFSVTGLELSEGMLARARSRTAHLPPTVRERLEWVQGDMSRFDLPGRHFALIFVAFNSFWLLPDLELQRACLTCMLGHLQPGGHIVLDLFPPNADDYRDEEGISLRLPAQRRGETLLRIKDYRYEATRKLAVSDVRYYAAKGEDAACARLLATFRYTLRLAEPAEVVALLESAGFTVEATYGSYARDPLDAASPRAIFVARRSAG